MWSFSFLSISTNSIAYRHLEQLCFAPCMSTIIITHIYIEIDIVNVCIHLNVITPNHMNSTTVKRDGG